MYACIDFAFFHPFIDFALFLTDICCPAEPRGVAVLGYEALQDFFGPLFMDALLGMSCGSCTLVLSFDPFEQTLPAAYPLLPRRKEALEAVHGNKGSAHYDTVMPQRLPSGDSVGRGGCLWRGGLRWLAVAGRRAGVGQRAAVRQPG